MVLSVYHMRLHEQGCNFRIVSCEFCGEKLKGSELDRHLQRQFACECGETMHECLKKLHSHFTCEKCNVLVPFERKKVHLSTFCSERIVTCMHCELLIPFKMLELHEQNVVCTICGDTYRFCLEKNHGVGYCHDCMDPSILVCIKSRERHNQQCAAKEVCCPFKFIGCNFKAKGSEMKFHETDFEVHAHLLQERVITLEQQAQLIKSESVRIFAKLNSTSNRFGEFASVSSTNAVAAVGNDGPVVVPYSHKLQLKETVYYGGVVCPEIHRTYFVPFESALQKSWQFLDHSSGQICSYAVDAVVREKNAYCGGVYCLGNSRVFFAPFAQGESLLWHVLDTKLNKILAYSSTSSQKIVHKYAYRGGVFAPKQNRIYLVPFQQTCESYWHYIQNELMPKVVAYSAQTLITPVNYAYHGGVYVRRSDRIVLFPNKQLADYWHYIDCASASVNTFQPSKFLESDDQKVVPEGYFGGCYHENLDRIYFAPHLQASKPFWHYLCCKTWNLIPYKSIPAKEGSYAGAVFSSNSNRIYFVPYLQQPVWHYVDCSAGIVSQYSSSAAVGLGERAYVDGVFCAEKKRIYFIPFHQSEQSHWHYIQE